MKRQKRRRGISLGTVVILLWTLMVLGCVMLVFPKLSGDTQITIDTSSMLQALSLSDGLPELSLSEIPIAGSSPSISAVPDITATVAPQQSVSATVQPVVQPTAAPVITPTPGGSFTLTIGGSINMDDALRKSGYYSESKKYDFSELFTLIEGELTGDVVLLSLENLVIPDQKVSTLNAPEAILTALRQAGVDVLTLGFPKAFDQKLAGVTATLTATSEAGLHTVGAYANVADDVGLVLDANGIQVGFLHYTQSLSSTGRKAVKSADAAFAVPLLSAEQAEKDIASLRERGAQAIVVSVHWDGSKSTPTNTQTEMAQQLANAGADVIVGTGTGIVQPAVWLDAVRSDGNHQQVLCAYSLGSLLNAERNNGDVTSMLLQLRLNVDASGHVTVEQAAYTPTYIWRYKQDSKYYYRIVASDQPSPDGMGDEQTEVKERALTNLQKYLGSDSVLTIRSK